MSTFFKDTDLTRQEADRLVSETLKNCDDGELFFESSKNESFVLDDNKIKNIKQYTFSIIEGISYQYMKKATEKYKKYIISVKINMGFFNVKTSTKEMENMFEDGQEAARLYIQKNKKC